MSGNGHLSAVPEPMVPVHSPSAAPDPSDWRAALQVLEELLLRHQGCVSTRALRSVLEAKGVPNARDLVVRLRYYDFEAPDDQSATPSFRWHGHAKSLYSAERYQKVLQDQAAEASQAEQQEVAAQESIPCDDDVDTVRRDRPRRQEERRLGTYVVSALESIYQSDWSPDDAPYVFDVHSDRPGAEFENIDLLAVHWRSERNVELVAVEVKLEFTARLVQQARNYGRFADRVWLAVPVSAEAAEASTALRDLDPLLFEHVVDSGLGILACRRRPGRSYEIAPVHWPRRNVIDPLEKEMFLERYRHHFESAGAMPPRAGRKYPAMLA
jgi:hypothetical protein